MCVILYAAKSDKVSFWRNRVKADVFKGVAMMFCLR